MLKSSGNSITTIPINNENMLEINYSIEDTIHEKFENIAHQYPDNIAIICQEKLYTYEIINHRANQLARYLLSSGIGSGNIVGILLKRSMEQIVAILAILKSGNTYLPLDLEHPQERIRWALISSNASLLVTKEEYISAVQDIIECVDIAHTDIAKQDINNPDTSKNPKSLAYVIYTSGTTGAPKGVKISHINVLSLLLHSKEVLMFTESDVWILFHSYCFDFSVWEMYGALLFGGRLVIPSEIEVKDTRLFRELLQKYTVTILNQTPTAFYNFIEHDLNQQDMRLKNLRYVILGGEALLPSKLKTWHEKYYNIQFVNMFGITETTVHVTYKLITAQDVKQNTSNIGRPLPSYYIYVVDEDNNLVPPGVPGELLIGGSGVAEGYLNNVELTLQKFIQDPFQANKYVYRSGDLVQYLLNGELEYLGRIDKQVKLRGFRIEPGEIESVLLDFPELIDARVVLKHSKLRGDYLCAYLIGKSQISSKEIRGFIAKKLPSYMIPAYIIFIDAFPRTINGKIDIESLPEPNFSKNIEFISKAELIHLKKEERVFLGIEKILHIRLNDIDLSCNFYEIGGDSIKAMQISMALYKMNVVLDVSQILAANSIREMEEFSTIIDNDFFPLDLQSETETIANNMQKYIFYITKLSKSLNAYYCRFSWKISGEVNIDKYKMAWQKIFDEYQTELKVNFYEKDGAVYRSVKSDMLLPLYFYDITHLTDKEQINFINRKKFSDYSMPFYLEKDCLIRVFVIKLRCQQYCLMVSFNHILMDGWSVSILLKKFLKAYNSHGQKMAQHGSDALITKKKPFLPFKDLFWKTELNSFCKPSLISSNMEITDSLEMGIYEFLISKDQYKRLLLFTQNEKITLNALFQIIWAIVLATHATAYDVLYGTVLSNRDTIDHEAAEELIGIFLETVPIRVQLNPEMTFLATAKEFYKKFISILESRGGSLENIISHSNMMWQMLILMWI